VSDCRRDFYREHVKVGRDDYDVKLRRYVRTIQCKQCDYFHQQAHPRFWSPTESASAVPKRSVDDAVDGAWEMNEERRARK